VCLRIRNLTSEARTKLPQFFKKIIKIRPYSCQKAKSSSSKLSTTPSGDENPCVDLTVLKQALVSVKRERWWSRSSKLSTKFSLTASLKNMRQASSMPWNLPWEPRQPHNECNRQSLVSRTLSRATGRLSRSSRLVCRTDFTQSLGTERISIKRMPSLTIWCGNLSITRKRGRNERICTWQSY